MRCLYGFAISSRVSKKGTGLLADDIGLSGLSVVSEQFRNFQLQAVQKTEIDLNIHHNILIYVGNIPDIFSMLCKL